MNSAEPDRGFHDTRKYRRKNEEQIERTWGLDDPGLVRLCRVAVTLAVGQALHHLAAAADGLADKP
jgi:hypothetical protein